MGGRLSGRSNVTSIVAPAPLPRQRLCVPKQPSSQVLVRPEAMIRDPAKSLNNLWRALQLAGELYSSGRNLAGELTPKPAGTASADADQP